MKEIPLTKGLTAMVDDEDFARVNAHKWCASLHGGGSGNFYARRWKKKTDDTKWKTKQIRMHHFILDVVVSELGEQMVVDHVDGNSLNNCRDNLRIISNSENVKKAVSRKEPWL